MKESSFSDPPTLLHHTQTPPCPAADGYHARLKPTGDICPDQAAVLILNAQITASSLLLHPSLTALLSLLHQLSKAHPY